MRSDSTKPKQEIKQYVYELLSASSPSSVSYFNTFSGKYTCKITQWNPKKGSGSKAVPPPSDSVSESSQCPKTEKRPGDFLGDCFSSGFQYVYSL